MRPGDRHYKAYVGPPEQYDFMGATQLRLLCALGLRAHHHVLDLGCGSLRAGRLLIPYLDEGRYFGIEPNTWLVEDAIAQQIGRDLVSLKKPSFDDNSEFRADVFSQRFDFVVAQSIFSHAGAEIIRAAMRNVADVLTDDAFFLATFIEGSSDFDGDGWIYPECVEYTPSTIRGFARDRDLFVLRLPWYHPRQTWYLFTRRRARLPNGAQLRHLRGAVLFDPEFADSVEATGELSGALAWRLKQAVPARAKRGIRRLLGR